MHFLLSFLQICSGIDENAVGACSELVFAPIDEMFPDDAPLVPSGFRIIPLDSKPVEFYVYFACNILYYTQAPVSTYNNIKKCILLNFV